MFVVCSVPNLSLACRMEARAPPRFESILQSSDPAIFGSTDNLVFVPIFSTCQSLFVFHNSQILPLRNFDGDFFFLQSQNYFSLVTSLIGPLLPACPCVSRPVSRALVSYRMSGWVVCCSSLWCSILGVAAAATGGALQESATVPALPVAASGRASRQLADSPLAQTVALQRLLPARKI